MRNLAVYPITDDEVIKWIDETLEVRQNNPDRPIPDMDSVYLEYLQGILLERKMRA